MQNLFFKKFLLGLIVVNSSLLFSMENEITEYNKYAISAHFNNNETLILTANNDNIIPRHRLAYYLNNKTYNNDETGIVAALDKKASYFNKYEISAYEKYNNEIADLNKIDRDKKDKIKQYLNNKQLDNIKYYFDNSDLNNDQVKTLYYTLKHKNNSYKEHYEKNEQNNDDTLLFMNLIVSMIQDIERKQAILSALQELNRKTQELQLNKLTREIQELKLNIQEQELNRKLQELFDQALQEEENEVSCPCVIL